MKYKINPVYRKEAKLRVRTIRFATMVFLYNLLLVGLVLFGFEMAFNIHWNNYIDYSRATLIYLLLIIVEMVMVIFIVPAYTAGSIAGEREKQTLDILLTTVLKPRQIILGKLSSSIGMVLLLVVSSLPVLSIVFTVGGVGVTDLIQFLVVAAIAAVFIGSIGILASCVYQKTVQATVFSFGMVLVVCVGTIAVVAVVYFLQQMYFWNVMQGRGKTPDVAWTVLLLLFNPVVTMKDMVSNQYGQIEEFSQIVIAMGGLPEFVMENWLYLSLTAQILASAVLLWLAERKLDPLRKKRKWRKRS